VCLIASIIAFLITFSVTRVAQAVEDVPAAAVPPAPDTSRAVSGLSGWAVELYQYDLFWYALTVVSVMVVMGVVIGFAMDALVSRLGIDLGKLEHRE
jgi:hypothetical protein